MWKFIFSLDNSTLFLKALNDSWIHTWRSSLFSSLGSVVNSFIACVICECCEQQAGNVLFSGLVEKLWKVRRQKMGLRYG